MACKRSSVRVRLAPLEKQRKINGLQFHTGLRKAAKSMFATLFTQIMNNLLIVNKISHILYYCESLTGLCSRYQKSNVRINPVHGRMYPIHTGDRSHPVYKRPSFDYPNLLLIIGLFYPIFRQISLV